MTDPTPVTGDSAGHGPPAPRAGVRSVLIVLLGVVLVGSLVYLLVLASGNTDLVHLALKPGASPTVRHPRPWLIVALVAGVLSLIAWGEAERQRSALAGAAGERDEARAAREQADEEAKTERQTLESERRELEQKLEAERDRRRQAEVRSERTVRAWRAERDFNRELRGHIASLQRSQGVLGRHDDVRDTVLELTMQLVEAEKGILVSAGKSGGEKLEVVAFAGFENDPSDSALARRFAGEVIDRDTTIREDAPSRADKHGRADDEVHNLLAIPIYLTDEFAGVIVCANREDGFADLDDEVLVAVGDHAGAVLQNSRLRGDLRGAYLSTIAVLADAIELKDQELRGHSDDVSHYVLAVADRMDFAAERREALIFASLLHDVGKLGISERILLKPAKLTPEERAVIELHPRIGYELIRQVPALREIAPAILHHHEHFDGAGYPSGLKGETIPLESRIIAIADTFSAMTSDRPYQRQRSIEDACAELERCAGSQFDPEVVRLFTEEVRRRPPQQMESAPEPDAEVELHRVDGEYKLGGHSFAITDSLTLLYSHRHFHESAHAEAQLAELQNRPFAVIVATLTDLWELNHAGGFKAGDEALRTVANLIQHLAAEHSALAFRASGRRIALLIPDADLEKASDITGTLRTRLLGSDALRPKVGLGTAVWFRGEDGEQVIERAQLAADRAEPVGS